jgi:nicotinamidase-related amidase
MMSARLAPRDMLPDPTRSALLIVDVQERLSTAMPADLLASVVRNTILLIETAREFNLPVLVSEQYPRGLGSTLPEVLSALPADTRPVEKLTFSCCGEPAFGPLLAQIAQYDLIISGMETHVCVLQTALDLLEQGHRVFVAADAVCSRTPANRQLGLELMARAGAVIGSTEIFAFGLLRAAGSERFKRISKIIK